MAEGDEEQRRAERFGRRFAALAATAADRASVEALRPEASTVIAAIVEAAGRGPLPDVEGPALREALTLASLLGRRAAYLAVTPVAALGIAPAIVEALRGTHDLTPIEPALTATVIDGYVRACEERERERGARRAADAIPFAKLAPRCFAFFVRGEHDPDELARRVDELGRALLEGDARACVVDLRGLAEPDRERFAQVFAVHSTCTMLGVRAIFVGLGEAWRDLAEEARVDLALMATAPTVADALAEAFRTCGLELRERRGLGGALRELLGRRG